MEEVKRIINLPLDFILGDRFGKYSKYIIQDRALPDVRDGLKPVQRRIIYAMLVNGNVPTKAYRKAATAVGFVIGHYHPHGDTSVYDAMVRMSQWWKQNQPLIDMQGNNGSLDADPPAAMRYTEARLAPISMELLKDIEKDTVNFAPNYDDTNQEPTVLPAYFPNLLVNGSEGIAAGYRTNIPPHNFKEVCEATVYRLKNPTCSLNEILEVIPGPDFPTGGIVRGKQGVIDAFESGSGQVQITAKTEFVNSKNCRSLVISEIPFAVVKSQLVAAIDKIRNDKEIDGILEVRDESDRSGLRIVIDLHKDADHDSIKTYLMKKADLSVRYSYNMVVICDKQPLQVGLLPILDYYIKHQVEVINRRVKFDLRKAEQRLHIVSGLIIAVSNLDEVIRIVRASKSKDEAKKGLMSRFSLTEMQAEAIVTLQLYRLNAADVLSLKEEGLELESKVAELSAIKDNEKKIKNILTRELSELAKKYPSPRLSTLEEDFKEYNVDKKPILKEDVMIAVSRDGYFKRSSLKSYSASGEGAMPGCKNGDIIVATGQANTADILLAFTDKANYLYIPIHELSENKWKDEGKHISNIISLAGDEKIIATILVKDFSKDVSLVLCSEEGLIKRTRLADYVVQRYSKPLKAMNISEGDALVSMAYADGDSKILVLTRKGKINAYHENKVSLVGVRAAGVKALKLAKDDEIAAMLVLNKGVKTNALIITDRGGLKVFNPYNLTYGNRLIKPLELYRYYRSETHHLVGAVLYPENNKINVLSTISGSREITFETTKATALARIIRSTLLEDPTERFTVISDGSFAVIDEQTKTYEPTEEIIENKPTTKEEEDSQQTIFDYLDDL